MHRTMTGLKRSLQLFVGAAAVASGAVLFAQAAPEITYDANADFLSLPANTYLGEVAGVATNSKGHIFVYTRVGHAVATLGDERTFYHGGSRLFEFCEGDRPGRLRDQLRAAGADRSAGQHLGG